MRFPGFDDEWAAVRLGMLLEFKNGINASKEQYGKGVKFINVLDILKQDYITYEKIVGKVDVDEDTVSKYPVKYGDILFQRSSETREEIGTANVYLDHQTATFGGFVIRGKKIGEYNPMFFNKLLKTRAAREQITSKSGGSTRYNVGQEILSSVSLKFPSLPEQEKISKFLRLVDKRIETQNKIIEKLETLIKGISDDLFSQKLKFPVFTEDWLIYRISDFLEFFSTNSLSWQNLEYQNSSFLSLHYGLIHQGLPIHIDLTECYLPGVKTEYRPNNYTLVQAGDLAFADASEDTNDVAKVVEFINCDSKKIVCGLHTIHARDKLNITVTGFKGYAFSSKSFRNQIRQLAQGMKVFSVSAKTFKECYMDIPSKKEQLKIANTLSLIDKKITVEKKLLAQLNKQKVYLLQNLFI